MLFCGLFGVVPALELDVGAMSQLMGDDCKLLFYPNFDSTRLWLYLWD
jgi:hypothetical protein